MRSLAGGGGRFHGWVNPTRSSGIRTVSLNESTGLLFQFWSIQRVTKRQLTDTVFPCTVATSV